MRIDFARPGGVWAPNIVPGRRLRSLDISQAKPVSGDLGGSWSPTKPINIGGGRSLLERKRYARLRRDLDGDWRPGRHRCER